MRLKKFLSAALSAAMLISCVSFGGGTVVQAAGEMNIARNLQISAYSGTEGDFPVSSVNDGRGDDTQNDNYRWFSKEALKGSGARGNAAYLIFDLGENGPRSFSGIDIRFHNMAYATNYKILTTDNSTITTESLLAKDRVPEGWKVLYEKTHQETDSAYLHKEVQRTNGVVRSYMQECIENLIVIKSFANEHAVCGKLNQFQKDNYRIRIKRNAISNLANTLVYVLFTAGYYAALVWGAFQISFGVMTFGTLTAFLQIIQQIRAPFRNVSGLIPQYYSMQASAERLMEIEDMEEESQKIRIEDVSEFQKDFRAIVAEHVTFAYQNGDIILDDVSLRVNKGDLIAIVGESGIGKSTMMKLMLHLMPCESGKLYFETVNGKIEIDAGTRNVFSYVPQGNMIMSGTIRENITFCNHDIGEEEIRKAAEIACIWDYIETLPQGLETVLTERGEGLSEGQVQRIAIARAILNDAPILLLDECTSSLDKDTEWKVLQNLKKMNTKTIICISHTAAGVACCDRVVEIENKKFKEVSNDD